MSAAAPMLERAAQLRRGFDHAFAELPCFDGVPTVDLLTVRIGGQGFAIRLSEVAALHVGKKITAVPGAQKALRGIAGFRGAILPVYDLAIILGMATGARTQSWLLIAKAAAAALSFDAFAGQRRVSSDAIVPHGSNSPAQRHIHALVRSAGWAGPVLDLHSVIEATGAATTDIAQQEKPRHAQVR